MGGRTFFDTLVLGKSAAVERAAARRVRRVMNSPDRKLLAEAYLPVFASQGGRILWVGCREYTVDDYAVLEAQGAEVWTTDIDPDTQAWGRAGRHRTGDICEAERLFADLQFDAVLCNGVLGYGVDRPEQQVRAVDALAAITRPGGRLLLGWNTNKIADPVASGLLAKDWLPEGFAGQSARVAIPESRHVYDSFVRA